MGQNIPGVRIPKVGDLFRRAAGVTDILLRDKPEYLVSYARNHEPAKLYAGQLQRDGTVRFSEVRPGQLNGVSGLPEVKQLAQMRAELAADNNPTTLNSALDVSARVQTRLDAMGMARPESYNAAFQDATDVMRLSHSGRRGTPGPGLENQVDKTRTDLIQYMGDQLREVKGLKEKDHPELREISPNSNPPITIKEAMVRSLSSSIESLQPAERLSNAVDAFTAQIVNAPAPGAAPAPAYNF